MMARILCAVALCWSSGAYAFDIETTTEIWSKTIAGPAGNGGADVARGVGIDGDGNVVTAGTLDGEPNHGTDGYVASWDADGVLRWEVTFDAGLVGLTDSVDRFDDLVLDNFDQITVVGRQASSGVAKGALYARAIDVLDGATLWERSLIDSVSPEQEAFGVGFSPGNNDLIVAGWSKGDLPAMTGRWLFGRFEAGTGADVWTPMSYDEGLLAANPDQAKDAAIDGFGTYTVVGRTGLTVDDSQWMVRRYDAFGALMWWQDEGGPLDDEATSVLIDSGGDLLVAGYTNVGSDNGAGRNDDWLVVKYSAYADAYGKGEVLWTYQYESAPGASERATGMAFDEDGDLLVVGTEVDAASGVRVWRAVELDTDDGTVHSARTWPAAAGDSVPWAIAQRDGWLAVAGSEGNADADLRVASLGSDLDLDGTIDSDDGCPEDDNKVEAGICGCGSSDQDADADGAADCDDICDGDPEKTEPGVCGCGFSDDDDDGDLIPSCQDACPETPADEASQVNPFGCGPSEQDGGEDTDVEQAQPPTAEKTGCESTGTGPVGLGLVAFAALALRRRQRPS